MSEAPDDAARDDEAVPVAETAGSLLRQARVAKGLHVAALATAIKVTPRKLELLEADRYDELPGAAFTRALAQTVCRALKIDPVPVMALLPQTGDEGLEQLSRGLNEPFRDKPGRRVPEDFSFLSNPVVLGALVLVVASVVIYLLPAGWVADLSWPDVAQEGGAPLPDMAASSVITLPAPTVVTPIPDADPAASTPAGAGTVPQAAAEPAPQAASAIAAVSDPVPAGALLLRTQAQSWVEVIDGRGNPLMSRLLEAGETVGLDGPTPLRVRIGNAAATQVSFRGRPVELTPSRDNVAKLELR